MESKSLELAKPFLGREVEVIIDRPLGAKHPKFGFTYRVNYGYIAGVMAPDGKELDAYYMEAHKPLQKATGTVIAIAHRTNDDDDKLIVVPTGTTMTDAEIIDAINFQEQWFQMEIVR